METGAAPSLECHVSKVKTLGLVLLGVIMVSGSALCTTMEDRPIAVVIGWIGVPFFGFALAVIIRTLFETGPRVVIDADGIEDRRWSMGRIPWGEVQALWIGSVQNNRFLCVEVLDPEPYIVRMPWYRRWNVRWNPSLGFPPITVAFAGLSPSLDEVCAYIEREIGIPVARR